MKCALDDTAHPAPELSPHPGATKAPQGAVQPPPQAQCVCHTAHPAPSKLRRPALSEALLWPGALLHQPLLVTAAILRDARHQNSASPTLPLPHSPKINFFSTPVIRSLHDCDTQRVGGRSRHSGNEEKNHRPASHGSKERRKFPKEE